MWGIRGRYAQAIRDDNPITWDVAPDGKHTLTLLAVSVYLTHNH